eukprot:scaffold67214_cov53-Attheya_sp.AAC.1
MVMDATDQLHTKDLQHEGFPFMPHEVVLVAAFKGHVLLAAHFERVPQKGLHQHPCVKQMVLAHMHCSKM